MIECTYEIEEQIVGTVTHHVLVRRWTFLGIQVWERVEHLYIPPFNGI